MADPPCNEQQGPPAVADVLTEPFLDRQQDESSSVQWLSVFNLANAAIGAGVLAFPYAFREAGALGGLIATFLIAVVEISALCILIRVAHRYSSPSYQELVYLAFGPRVSNLASSFIWTYLFGSCVAYLIIIGDVFLPTAQTLFGPSNFFAQRWVVLSLIAALVVLPLSLKKTLRSLGVFSSVAPLTLIYLAVAILVCGAKRVINAGGIPEDVILFGPLQGYCKAASIVVFAFQCHIQLMPIFAELVHACSQRGNSTRERAWSVVSRHVIRSMDVVILLALGTCLIGYSLVGVFGYIAVPDVKSDVLSSFSEDNKAMYIARVGMGFVAIVSYPINHFPARLIELSGLNYFWPLHPEPDSPPYMLRYNAVTVVYVAVTLAVAIAVRDLGKVYMVIGSTGGVLVIFVIPALLLLDAAGVLPSSKRGTLVSNARLAPEPAEVDTEKRQERRSPALEVPDLEGPSLREATVITSPVQRASSPHFTSIPHVGQRPSEESDDIDLAYVSKSQRELAVLWAALMLLLGVLVFSVTVWLVVAGKAGQSFN